MARVLTSEALDVYDLISLIVKLASKRVWILTNGIFRLKRVRIGVVQRFITEYAPPSLKRGAASL